jgi:hypothetical protein
MTGGKDAKNLVQREPSARLSSTPPTSKGFIEPPDIATEIARLQKEEKERKELYEKAHANFTAVIEEVKV